MSYTKITTSFKDHETVLTAAHLQHLENGIADNDAALVNRVRTDVSNQGLTAAQKSNARMNIDTPSTAEMTAAVAAEADLRSAADAAMETKTDGIQDEVDQAKEDITDLQSVSSSMVKTKMVTGNHMTIKDALAGKAKKLVVNLEPKQNLNGYSKPWVGGTGKNLCPLFLESGTKNGITYTLNENGTVTFSGTQNMADTSDVYFHRTDGNNNFGNVSNFPAGSYRYSAITGGSNSSYRLYVAINENGSIRYLGINDGYGEFTLAASAKVVMFIRFFRDVTVNNLTVYPMIYSSDASDDFEPYENICPISGYDTVEVTSAGKNLLDTSCWAVKSGATNMYLKLLPNTKYTMSADVPNSSVAGGGLLYVVNSTGNPSYGTNAVYSGKPITVETNNDGVVRIVFYGRDFITDWSAWQIQLELGSTATDYEPYQGNSIAVDVKSLNNNGSVYSGTLTINEDGSGELVVNRAKVSFSGMSWAVNGTYANTYNIVLPSSYPRHAVNDIELGKSLSNKYLWYSSSTVANHDYGFAMSINNDLQFYVKDKDVATAEEANAKFTDLEISYLLHYPITHPLTTTQISTLLSENHLWTNGTKLELTYRVDKYGEADKLLSLFPVRTVGPNKMVAFDDGADVVPVKGLSISIEPHQDLHGYTKPWTGGHGKNLCPMMEPTNQNNSSFGNIVTTINRDGSVTLNGTTANGARHYALSPSVTVDAGTTYILSGCPSGGGLSTYRLDIRDSSGVNLDSELSDKVDHGNGITFTPSTTHDIRIAVRLNSDVTVSNQSFYPMLRLATETDATYEPYSNISPIIGFMSLNLTHNGKNIFPTTYEDGTISPDTGAPINDTQYYRVQMIRVKPNSSYFISWSGTVENASNFRYFTYNANGEFKYASGTATPKQISTSGDIEFISFRWLKSYNLKNLQLEEGTSNTAYDSYQETKHTISLEKAGTIYGGTLTINEDSNGLLVVNKKVVRLTSDMGWTRSAAWDAGCFYTYAISDIVPVKSYSTIANIASSHCGAQTANDLSKGSIGIGQGSSSSGDGLQVFVNFGHSSKDELISFLDNNNVQFEYMLASPHTYIINTPQLQTFLGNNTFSCDAGKITLSYRADPSLLINKLLTAMTAYGISM